MKRRFPNWPFSEDEEVTISWITSPWINDRGAKVCEVHFRTKEGDIKPVIVGWGYLPALWIGRKFSNRKLIKEEYSDHQVTVYTDNITDVTYGKASEILPGKAENQKDLLFSDEWWCSFEYRGYKYFAPCVEIARAFLARTTVLANNLLSSGGLEDMIDLSTWEVKGKNVKFDFRKETPGISGKLAKIFAAIYGMSQLHLIWNLTYTDYVASGQIRTNLPPSVKVQLFYSAEKGTNNRFIHKINFSNMTTLFRNVLYGPPKIERSKKRTRKKQTIKKSVPSEKSELDASGTLAKKTGLTLSETSLGESFLDQMKAKRRTIKETSPANATVMEQEDIGSSFSIGDVSGAGQKPFISIELDNTLFDADPDFTLFCRAIELLGKFEAITIGDLSFSELPQGKRISLLNMEPIRARKFACVSVQNGDDDWLIIELCNKDGYSISTLFTKCVGNKEELVNSIIDKLLLCNGSWSRKRFPKQEYKTLDHHESRTAERWAELMFNKLR